MSTNTFLKQVAIVPGAGEGIGLEIAKQLVDHGARVLLNDINPDRAKEAADEISADGHCIPFPGDAGDADFIQSMVDAATNRFGRLDIAIANAGITVWNPFLEYTVDDFFRVVTVNLAGSFFLAQKAAQVMIDQERGGRILFMSSVTGRRAIPYLSAYSMTKAGLEGLTKNLVAELSPHGITINAIAPGATVTPRNLADDPNYESSWGELIPTREVAYSSDIARTALFLVNPDAGQINGQTLVIDGGWTNISPIPTLDFVDTSDDPSQENK